MQKEEKGREEKDKKLEAKRPKNRIVPWEEMVENERKAKEKEKEREGRPTLAALMEEQLLGSMASDEVGIPPQAPPPRPSAYLQAARTKIRPFRG